MRVCSTILLLLFLFLAACGSGITDNSSEDTPEVADTALPDLQTEPDSPEVLVFPDVPRIEVLPEVYPEISVELVPDVPDLACDPGEGCFMDQCDENGDCQSNWCVEHLGDGVCTQACQEECPAGWKCKQVGGTDPDVIFICVSDHANLCKPCANSSDCSAAAGAQDVCVDYGEQGAFCGGQCLTGGDCPWGFSCGDAVTTDGIEVKQCINDAGVCPCTDKSVGLALWTPCKNDSQWGSCPGKRVCTEEGLTECDAPSPTEEICNGFDDDCDNETDEPPLVEGEYGNLCDDDNVCTEDKCKGLDGCQNLPTDGVECLDGDLCTIGDHCVQDVCVGTPVECEDDNPCTDDSCDVAGDCAFIPNDDACDDGNPCSVADQCQDGQCAGTLLPCDCQVDDDCQGLEDGNLCNGTLVCSTDQLPFQCIVDEDSVVHCPPPEDGPDAVCQQEHCVPETGECQVVPANDGFACDDEDACTAGDKCGLGTCNPGIEINCADDNPCTDDSCDSLQGCVHTPNEKTCSDGNVCTVGDNCADGLCEPGVDLDCDDTNPCTADNCDPVTGCTHEPVDTQCDDGNACTQGDHCAGGACVFDEPTACHDDNVCTADSCDPAQGCIYTNTVGLCNDNDPCTIDDFCADGVCQSGAGLDCDDLNPCTDDQCNEQGQCVFAPNDSQCDDGNACTQGDHCAGGACVFDEPTACHDDNACTDDSCDPVQGCIFAFNQASCDDGNICTVGDICSSGVCIAGQPLECDDGNLCNGEETCNIQMGCWPGQPLVCNDENICTSDSCVPLSGCLYEPVEGQCDDANNCTLNDTCQAGTCVPGEAVTISPPEVPTGPALVCAEAEAVWSTVQIDDADSYGWTIPDGASIVAGEGTHSITVLLGEVSGTVAVTASNDCAVSEQAQVEVTVTTCLDDGIIVAWSGTLGNLPEGWKLCDGTNGTPDLRSRFVKGVEPGGEPGSEGGSESPHDHGGTNTETMNMQSTSPGGRSCGGASCTWKASNSSHSHTFNHAHSVDSQAALPPFYDVLYIMADNAGPLPADSLIGWSGILSQLPDQWSLCDGQGDTPDLQGRFLRGAEPGQDSGGTGGDTTHGHGGTTQSFDGNSGNHVNQWVTVGCYGASASDHSHSHSYPHTHSLQSSSNLPPYVELAFLITAGDNAAPQGAIAFWSGSTDEIPAAWHACDGTEGTPDLANQFFMGTDAGEDPGNTGGSTEHAHVVGSAPGGTSSTNGGGNGNCSNGGSYMAFHSHTVPSHSHSTQQVDHEPPYRRLVPIMLMQ